MMNTEQDPPEYNFQLEDLEEKMTLTLRFFSDVKELVGLKIILVS